MTSKTVRELCADFHAGYIAEEDLVTELNKVDWDLETPVERPRLVDAPSPADVSAWMVEVDNYAADDNSIEWVPGYVARQLDAVTAALAPTDEPAVEPATEEPVEELEAG